MSACVLCVAGYATHSKAIVGFSPGFMAQAAFSAKRLRNTGIFPIGNAIILACATRNIDAYYGWQKAKFRQVSGDYPECLLSLPWQRMLANFVGSEHKKRHRGVVMAVGLASVVTGFFAVIMLGVFVGAVYTKRQSIKPGFYRHASGLIMSLGILGALSVMVLGLLSFDVNAIPETMGGLLAGLKSALLIAVFGIALSISFRGLATFGALSPDGADEVDESQIGTGELYRVMVQQRDGTQQLLAVTGDQSAAINKLVAQLGGEDASLMTQLKRQQEDHSGQHQALMAELEQQRQTFEQFQKQLRSDLGDFSQTLSKAATEQVISALQEVVLDFNLSMTDQFGENFKRFNDAVIQLAQWQDNYKEQLEDMREQYAGGVSAITSTDASLAAISGHAQQIPEVMHKLQQVIEVNQHQIDELSRHLGAFSDVRERAVEAMPALNARIDTAVDGFERASKSLIKGVDDSSAQVQQALLDGTTGFVDGSKRVNDLLQVSSATLGEQNEQMRSSLESLVKEINGSLSALPAELVEGSRKITEDLSESGKTIMQQSERSRQAFDAGLQSMRDQLAASLVEMSEQQTAEARKIFAGLHQQIERTLGETGDAVTRQVKTIDEGLAKEIATTLSEMGSALTSITGQFTDDYKELVGAMKNVVKAA